MQLINLASVACLLIVTAYFSSLARAEEATRSGFPLQVDRQADSILIKQDSLPVATYVFRDPEIRRPYFANVHTPSGTLATRHHPPRPGSDATDHTTMHPGIWLAFGDISGHDFWRNKGRVDHLEFVHEPEVTLSGQDGVVTFTVRNRYLADDKTICHELARHTIRATKDGYLFTFDSQLSSSESFHFGDQEEMGLGLRLATPLIVKGGTGTFTSSDGVKNEKQVWGRQAQWCDYSGLAPTKVEPVIPGHDDRHRIGMLLVPHPKNFRPSWMHARDYGLVVANPFGQRAFAKSPASRVEIRPGETLRLRFGVWAYAANEDEKVDCDALAADYLRLAE